MSAVGCLLMYLIFCFWLFPRISANVLCLSGVMCEQCFLLLHVLLTQCMVQRSLRHDDFDTKNTFCTISIDNCKKVPFIFSALFDFDGIPEAISIMPVFTRSISCNYVYFYCIAIHSLAACVLVVVVVVVLFFTICYLFTLFANWLRYCIRTKYTTPQKWKK